MRTCISGQSLLACDAVLLRHGGRESFGQFPTAAEAANAIARVLAVAKVSAEKAMAAVETEGLTLARSYGRTGFTGVQIRPDLGNIRRMYFAKRQYSGSSVEIGSFASPEEAALAVLRRDTEERAERPKAAAGEPQWVQCDGCQKWYRGGVLVHPCLRPIGATVARQIPVLKVTRSNRVSVTGELPAAADAYTHRHAIDATRR